MTSIQPLAYLSFLGLGSWDSITGKYDYRPTVYELNGKLSSETKFVQVAEMEILGASSFQKLIIVTTEKSSEVHFRLDLQKQLKELGCSSISEIMISEDMSPEGQWKWFEQILEHVDYGCKLTVDLTHGYRSIPIVFSSALNFLQKTKRISIDAVYYGRYEAEARPTPIIDMKDFFMINEWAEAVGRLVDDADARKLAQVAQVSPPFQVKELNDEEMIQAFEDLTNSIRNVEVNNIPIKAAVALQCLERQGTGASATGRILIELLRAKFATVASTSYETAHYDKAYFSIQLEIIRLLLEHKLFMQAFTAMRELMASIGMIPFEEVRVNSAKGRKRRKKYAEIFTNMLQYEESEWHFTGEREKAKEKLYPFYEKLKRSSIISVLRQFSKELADYRNGFDHAWTMKSKAHDKIQEKGKEIYERLVEVIERMCNEKILC